MADATKVYDLEEMLKKFGMLTVMDAKFYTAKRKANADDWDSAATLYDNTKTKDIDPLFTIKTLKLANFNVEGPNKSIVAGQRGDIVLKYGKTYTVEMQDALGDINVMKYLYGVKTGNGSKDKTQFAFFTNAFPKELTIIGDTYVIDQATGYKQPIKIVIPFFLGNGIGNIATQVDGDAAVFDIKGDVLAYGSLKNADSTSSIYVGGNDLYYFFCTEQGLIDLKTANKDYAMTSN